MTNTQKGDIFRVYNALKSDMATNPVIEAKRLNKALGLALGEEIEKKPYKTTFDTCECPDMAYRSTRIRCKHVMAYWMLHPAEFFSARFLGNL